MIKEIVKDIMFLGQKSTPSTIEDLYIVQDLIDTLNANLDGCVGLAANMIGYHKNIIIAVHERDFLVMLNPVILKSSGAYETDEGCLSLIDKRKTRRYNSIKVQYQNDKFSMRIKTFTGFTAQIIQHEIDHCNGIII